MVRHRPLILGARMRPIAGQAGKVAYIRYNYIVARQIMLPKNSAYYAPQTNPLCSAS